MHTKGALLCVSEVADIFLPPPPHPPHPHLCTEVDRSFKANCIFQLMLTQSKETRLSFHHLVSNTNSPPSQPSKYTSCWNLFRSVVKPPGSRCGFSKGSLTTIWHLVRWIIILSLLMPSFVPNGEKQIKLPATEKARISPVQWVASKGFLKHT